ncbi:MAG: glycine zipper 2TM domain-containing protein [Betaproteobacteria bacterium]|nr:glycine zipper 2TM domain-containing protein [Betaproteobacteria bacterium]
MNKTALTALLALSLPMSGNALAADFSDTAQVISAVPIYERFNEPKRDCWLETTTPQTSAVQGDRSPAGAIIGGLAGGILGHQVGKGSGKDAATALGAITGAIVGDRMQNNAGATQTVERCRVTDHWTQRLTGYSVTYRYGGREFTAVLPNDPGSRLRVNVQVSPF